jgi:hypothetical protein
MATAPPTTTGLSGGWWDLPNTSAGGNYLPSYSTQCQRKAKKIIKDYNHPSHYLFTPLSIRRRGQYRCIKAGTERLKDRFYLKAIRLLTCCDEPSRIRDREYSLKLITIMQR